MSFALDDGQGHRRSFARLFRDMQGHALDGDR